AALEALSTERLITAAEVDRAQHEGGKALFERHVLRLFAIGWVILFVASAQIPWLGGAVERQLFFNLVLVMLGGSLLILKRYRLRARGVLAPRPVKPVVWIAVLAGAPALLLTGIAIARISATFLPVPQDVLESFGRALIPPGMSLGQMLLYISVLP